MLSLSMMWISPYLPSVANPSISESLLKDRPILSIIAHYFQLASASCERIALLPAPATADSIADALLRCARLLSYTIPMVGMLRDGYLSIVVPLFGVFPVGGEWAAGLCSTKYSAMEAHALAAD